METKQSHRRSSSATNFAGKAGEEVSLDQDFDWGDTDFLSSEAFTKEQNNRTPDRLFKTGEVPTKNMVATSSGGDRSEKKLVITVSTSPTDNLSSPEPTSQERKVSTGSMDLRRNANALDGTRVPTPTPPDTPEDRVNITLDNEEDAANHSHNDSFSLLPDLGREFSNSSARNSPPMMPYMSIGTRPSWEMEEDAEMVELKQGKTGTSRYRFRSNIYYCPI